MPALPSLTSLRAFESAARLGSFTAAALELHVTQAAVSRSIKALESQLGFVLFERAANMLSLTRQGRELLPELGSAFRLIGMAVARARAVDAIPVLTVGVGVTFAIRWLIPRLPIFRHREPGIELRIATGGPSAKLRSEWTCSIRLGRDPSPDVISVPLFSPRMTPVCAPAVGRQLHHPADLLTVPLLDVEHTPGDWKLWMRAASLEETRAERRDIFPSYSFALQAALDGLGVAMGLHPYVVDDIAANRLIAPFEISVTKPDGWFLSFRREAEGNVSFQKFRGWLTTEASGELGQAAHAADETPRLARSRRDGAPRA